MISQYFYQLRDKAWDLYDEYMDWTASVVIPLLLSYLKSIGIWFTDNWVPKITDTNVLGLAGIAIVFNVIVLSLVYPEALVYVLVLPLVLAALRY